MTKPDILLAIQPVVKVLEKLSISYYIGGSIASSVYGMARSTLDVDLVAAIKIDHISSLKQKFEKDYYIDEHMISDAIERESSFNLIHLETMIKIDVFIHKNEPYHQEAIQRKVKDTLYDNNKSNEFYFSSPEDIIINKLQWYETGGRISEHQWLDFIGVIKVQGELLDIEYLQNWSKKLRIYELLKKAIADAGALF